LQSTNDINYDTPGIEEDVYITALRLVMIFSKIEEDEAKSNERKLKRHTVFVFLPGLYEIEQMFKKLEETFKKELVHLLRHYWVGYSFICF
jgi:HrpA-like RNA helicase